jgi:hypothetical protein
MTITTADTLSNSNAEQRPRLTARMIAIVMADRFDKQLATGAMPKPGSAMAAHAQRVGSPSERLQLADSLCAIANGPRTIAQIHRVPVHPAGVESALDLIDEIVGCLLLPTSVGVAGVARLRMLLGDAAGPFYSHGSGDLRSELRAVLAAM